MVNAVSPARRGGPGAGQERASATATASPASARPSSKAVVAMEEMSTPPVGRVDPAITTELRCRRGRFGNKRHFTLTQGVGRTQGVLAGQFLGVHAQSAGHRRDAFAAPGGGHLVVGVEMTPLPSGVGAAAVACRAASDVSPCPARRSQSRFPVSRHPAKAKALAPSVRVARSLDPVLVMSSRLISARPG